MSTVSRLLTPFTTALLLATALSNPALAACVTGADIDRAIADGNAATLSTALTNAGESGSLNFVSQPELCDDGNGPYYLVSVLDKNGNQRQLRLPASR